MYFRYRLSIVRFYNVKHLLNSQFPALFLICIKLGVSTKLTAKHTYIGRLNMKITIKISVIAMLLFSHPICQRTGIRKRSFFKQHYPFLKGQTLIGKYLFANLPKVSITFSSNNCFYIVLINTHSQNLKMQNYAP